jgi:hypothetical protein
LKSPHPPHPPSGNDHAADARTIVSRVKRKPPPFEVHLKPRAKIHGRGVRSNSYVPKVAGTVSSGDVHASAQGHGKVRKVTTHTDLLTVCIKRRSIIARERVPKFNVVVNEVADLLHPIPSRFGIGKALPRKLR